ncbi:hypothetical protein LIER_37486 [Lithospermum erythrorhizon]|uniref:Reverse transcriptase zinc-binding domain-containing protein n=1 Tax=Lithospermum erythrorhizon TaxID=34254 RepID=A0AAV3PQ27_LITER
MKRNGDFKGVVLGEGSTGKAVDPCLKNIWSSRVPPRVKIFIWKCVSNILPTKDRLRRRVVLLDSNCVLCQNANEDLLHLFLDCPFSCSLWFSTPLNMCTTRYPWTSFKEWWTHVTTQFKAMGCEENFDKMACLL